MTATKRLNSSAKMQGILAIILLAISKSSQFEITGNAAGITGNADRMVVLAGNAAGIAGNAAGITGNADRMVVLAGNAAGIPGNAAGMAGLAEDDSTTEKAVRMEDGMTGAVTGIAGVAGMENE